MPSSGSSSDIIPTLEEETDIKVYVPEILAMPELELELEPELKPEPEPKPKPVPPFNNAFIEILETLSDILMKQGEPFRARAYQKAEETIMGLTTDIMSPEQLKGLPGIGSTIMKKLNEFVETGTLRVLEREKNNPINMLADIYGVGPKKAKELVEKGITTIAQLRERQNELLNETQKIGLKYYEDILVRIPRSEIDEYAALFSSTFSSVSNGLGNLEIVGSYRRGAQTSGDIDVIITAENPQVFTAFLDKLISQGIIIHVLSRGPTKCLVIAKLHPDSVARRIDFLYTSHEEYPFAVLYFTGSKIFNTVMRNKALRKGFTMNEHGLYLLEGKKKMGKVPHIFKDERSIFDFLGLQYKNPQERIDGRAVIEVSEPISIPLEEAEPFALKSEATKITAPLKKKPKLVIVEEYSPITPVVAEATSPKAKTVKKKIAKKRITTIKNIKLPSEKDQIKSDLDIISDFKREGITVLEALSEKRLTEILTTANVAYRNLEPVMTDSQFDIIQDYLEAKYPANVALKQIGAPILIEKNKVALPYFMGSMNKIKPDTGALSAWMAKYSGPYVLSCKLDGVSGLYTTEGPEPKLYTRGEGTVGQDISYFITYLRLPKDKGIVIRGEFIMPKSIFAAKYKDAFANPRNLISGIVNRLTIDEKASDMHFVAYEVIKPELRPSKQMEFLEGLDVETVLHRIEPTVTNDLLSELLVDWRKNYPYEIDGVICTDDKLAQRKSGNPENAFAFKMVLSDQVAEATVVDVLWTPSKDGYLKPRVRIEPIHLGGVVIEYATGFNGQFIQQNKIGIGAIIQLVRSGDVIPHIRGVTLAADTPKMPDIPYKWNDTHVDIMLENAGLDETVREKNITGFFRGIGVDGLSTGNVARIVEAGFDSVPKIIHMTKEDFLKVDGFKDKLATKIYTGIREKLEAASLVTLMAESNIFGRGIGERKIEPIMEAYPAVLTDTVSVGEKVAALKKIKGMAQKTALAFVEKIPVFLAFLNECGLGSKLSESAIAPAISTFDTTHPLFNKSIVMTGFRDESLKEKLKTVGAKLGSSVSKNTFALIVKDKETGTETGKAEEALLLGVPILGLNEFVAKYF